MNTWELLQRTALRVRGSRPQYGAERFMCLVAVHLPEMVVELQKKTATLLVPPHDVLVDANQFLAEPQLKTFLHMHILTSTVPLLKSQDVSTFAGSKYRITKEKSTFTANRQTFQITKTEFSSRGLVHYISAPAFPAKIQTNPYAPGPTRYGDVPKQAIPSPSQKPTYDVAPPYGGRDEAGYANIILGPPAALQRLVSQAIRGPL